MKKSFKKLSLNKLTISNLDMATMNNMIGAAGDNPVIGLTKLKSVCLTACDASRGGTPDCSFGSVCCPPQVPTSSACTVRY